MKAILQTAAPLISSLLTNREKTKFRKLLVHWTLARIIIKKQYERNRKTKNSVELDGNHTVKVEM